MREVKLKIRLFQWLIEDQGHSADRIFLSGVSAGGHLAQNLVQHLVEQSLPRPAGLVLFTPGMDATGSCPSRRIENHCILPPAPMDGVSGEPDWIPPPYASLELVNKPSISPIYTPSNPRFPPTWIQTGDVDRLRDEDLLRFIQLASAGVPVRCELYAEATHLMSSELAFRSEPAALAHKNAAAFIAQAAAGTSREIKAELAWVDAFGKVSDLEGMKGAKKILQSSLDKYAGFVPGGKDRIRQGWSRFGFLGIWEKAVGSV